MKGLFGLIGLAALMGCEVGSSTSNILSVQGVSTVQLREFESKELTFQYIDANGYPILGGAVRLRIEGMPNGAVLETVVARSDQTGVARSSIKGGHEATFTLVAEAEGAMPVQIPVSVSRANGGMLSVTVYSRSVATANQAQVTLASNVPCSAFDPRMPPPAASVPQPTQNVTVSTTGTPVQFSGLLPGQQYTLFAIAQNGGSIVAKACQDGLSVTQQEVEQRLPKAAALYLEDFSVDISGNQLLVQTNFQYPLHLTRVANLIKDMSDSPSDPLDFIIERALAKGDYWTSLMAGVIEDQLAAYVVSQRPSNQLTRAKLQQVQMALSNVSNVMLYTSLKINDESEEHPGQLTATHKFEYFTAHVNGVMNRYYLHPGVNLYGDAPKMKLTAEAKLTKEGQRLRFDEHTLSLPIAEAIIGTLLVDTFGESNLDAVLVSMIDCGGIGGAVADYYNNNMRSGAATSVEKSAVRSGMNSACRSILANMAGNIYNDIRKDITDSGYGSKVTLRGHGEMGFAADGSTINQLTAGEWIGVGTFTASR